MILLLVASLALASPEQAVEAYVAGDYPRAEALGREAVAQGSGAADVYYNLGAALYQQGELAPAILAWRRAALLAPRDGDIQANLDRARRQVRDRLDPAATRSALFWSDSLSLAEQGWAAAALLGVLGVLGALGRLRPGLALGLPAALVGVPGVLLALSTAAELVELDRSPGGVVLAEQVEVRSAGEGGVVLFTLHAGAELTLVAEVGGFTQIALPDGRRGWVPSAALGRVDPRQPMPGPG